MMRSVHLQWRTRPVYELLNIFIDNMVPVLAIAGVGLYLRRRFALDPTKISSMMFHVFSPALAFNALYTRDISGGDFLRMYGGTLALLWTIAAIAFLVLRLQKVKSTERAAALVSTFVFNGGNFGISIVSFAFGAEALSYAVIAYVAGSTTAYTCGVYASSNGKASMLQSLGSIARTPSVYALIAAFGLKAAGIVELPPARGCGTRIRLRTKVLLHSFGLIDKEVSITRQSAWHSVNSNVHHVCSKYKTGNNIEKENRRSGTGNKPMSEECKGLVRRRNF